MRPPADKFVNLFFRAKMALLGLAGIAVWLFFRTVHCSIDDWDNDPVPPPRARLAGGLTLLLWVAILAAGRMIPYQQYWLA